MMPKRLKALATASLAAFCLANLWLLLADGDGAAPFGIDSRVAVPVAALHGPAGLFGAFDVAPEAGTRARRRAGSAAQDAGSP
jgi:hypothetical protein